MLKSTRRQCEMGGFLTPGVNGQRGGGGNIAIGISEGKGRDQTGIEDVNGKSGIQRAEKAKLYHLAWPQDKAEKSLRAKRSCWTGGMEVDGT